MKKFIIILVLIIIVLLLGMKIYVNKNKNMFQIPVLMYHDIIMDEYYDNDPNGISYSAFQKQLEYFKDNNYKTLTLDEFYEWIIHNKKIPKKSVLLTFDDGYYSFHYLVEPLLEKYNMHASCFVIGASTNDETPSFDPAKYGAIGKDQILNHSSFVEYGSHSFGLHEEINGVKKVKTLTKKQLDEDVKKMQNIYDFHYMVYPFNTDTKDLITVLKSNNYKLAFRGESEYASRKAKPYQIPRIGIKNDFDEFKQIMESDEHHNRYGYGIIRKIMITIERILGMRLFK